MAPSYLGDKPLRFAARSCARGTSQRQGDRLLAGSANGLIVLKDSCGSKPNVPSASRRVVRSREHRYPPQLHIPHRSTAVSTKENTSSPTLALYSSSERKATSSTHSSASDPTDIRRMAALNPS